MDQAEIARSLGVSRRTIGYRLDRFRAEAQKALGDDAIALGAGAGVPKPRGETP
jgi:DNA-directed RNA polymerase specialized sigma24 family protein